MRCGKAEQMLGAYLDGRLGEEARRELEAHLAECTGCRRTLRLLQGARAGLRGLGPAEPPPGLAARAVRAAFEGGKPAPSWLDRLFPMAWPAAAASAAAAVALALLVNVTAPAAPPGDLVAQVASVESVGLDPDAVAVAVLAGEE
jgi:anti-sigma factor RsiW